MIPLDGKDKVMIAVIAFCALTLAVFVITHAGTERPVHDDSDPPQGRSGLNIKTDSLTGCQYIVIPGFIAQRMGADGKQICRPTIPKCNPNLTAGQTCLIGGG